MYGRKSEIQRIQSKLQRIGQNNPHRVSALEQVTSENDAKYRPTDDVSDLSAVTASNEFNGEAPFLSTHDRYNSPAGKQALRTMAQVAEQHPPFPDAVTFFPQHPWPDQIHPVSQEVQEDIHQLADTLRQPSQQNYTSCSLSPNPDDDHHTHGYWHDGQRKDSRIQENEEKLWNHAFSSVQVRPRFTLSQGLVWLAVAIVVRVGIDRLLLHFPHLWIVMAAMVLTPVAIALYQTAVNPRATVHSGRRLLVIMMGLLIGGQL